MKKHNAFIKALLWIGLVRLHTGYGLQSEAEEKKGTVVWPIKIAPWWMWAAMFKHPKAMSKTWGLFYVFRNRSGVVKWEKDRLLPRRWGFGILGLIEFGDRG